MMTASESVRALVRFWARARWRLRVWIPIVVCLLGVWGLGAGLASADPGSPTFPPPPPDPATALQLYLSDTTLAAASDATGSPAPTDPPGAPDPVAASEFPELMAAAKARDAAERAAQQAAANLIGPSQSSSQFSGESPSAALSTDRSAFGSWLTSPLQSGAPIGAGQRLVRLLGDHQALLDAPHGRRVVLLSTLPLVGQAVGGGRAPVDLNLQSTGGAYRPASSAVPVSLPAVASGEARFLDQGFGFSLDGAGAQPAVLSHGRLLYADVGRAASDTDAVFQAVGTGVEVSWVLRSAKAAEDHAVRFELPAGARLVLIGTAAGGGQTVRIERSDGSLLGFVMAPSARDAAGRTVPSSYSLSGADTLVMHVSHREGSWAYPILADPLVSAYSAYLFATWHTAVDAGWSSYFTLFGLVANGYTYAAGPKSCPSYCNTAWGEWFTQAAPGAYIYEEYLNGVYHFPDASEEYAGLFGPNPGYFPQGSWKDSTGQSGPSTGIAARSHIGAESGISTDYCLAGTTSGTPGSCPVPAHNAGILPNDSALAAGIELTGATSTAIPEAAAYGADLYESDDITPTLSAPTHSGYTPGTWSNSFTDNVTLTGSVSTGLGMSALAIGQTNTPFSSPLAQASLPCSTVPCATSQTSTLTYSSSQLPEGIDTIYAQAQNAGGNLSTTQSWQAEIDRTPPPAPGLSGMNNSDAVVDPEADPLTITPTDPPGPGASASSGPASVTVVLDGVGSAPIPCATTCTWTPPATLAEGGHTVSVTATDGAGNTGPAASLSFVVDQTPAAVSVSGPAYDDQAVTPSSGTLALHVDATDASSSIQTAGVVSIATYIDDVQVSTGPTASQSCAQGGCALSADGTINVGQLSAGEHRVEVTATDAAGNVGSANWTLDVGGSPTSTTPTCAFVPPTQQDPGDQVMTVSGVLQLLSSTAQSLLSGPTLADVGAQAIQPVLSAVGQNLASTGSDVGALIPTNGSGAFAIGDGASAVCMSPVADTSGVTPGQLNGSSGAIFANTDTDTNAILRPIADGIASFEQLTAAAAPTTSTWTVALGTSEKLEQIDPATVAIVDTSTGGTGGTTQSNGATTPGTVPSETALGPATSSTADQALTEAGSLLEAEEQVADGTVVAVISAPTAVDARNAALPTALTANQSTSTVTMKISGSPTNYPVTAAIDSISDTDTSADADTMNYGTGPADPQLANADNNGTTQTTVEDDIAAQDASTKRVNFTCKLSVIAGAKRDQYPYASPFQYTVKASCPGPGPEQYLSVKIVNEHHKIVDGPHKCVILIVESSCQIAKTISPTPAQFTTEFTVDSTLTADLAHSDGVWAPANSRALKGCVGYATPFIHCHFTDQFELEDHRCDLTQAGITADIPVRGDRSQRYVPVPGYSPFTTSDGRSAILNEGFWDFSKKDGSIIGFGYAHITVKHGWDEASPTPIYSGSSSTPNQDATRAALNDSAGKRDPNSPNSYYYDDPNTYTGANGVSCSRRVVIQPTGTRKQKAGGLITSFGRTSDEGDTAG